MEVDERRGDNVHSRGHQSQPHGTKRRANDELENSQRLAKRFHLLSLGSNNHYSHDPCDRLTWLADSNGKLWIPPQSRERNAAQQRTQPLKDQSDLMEVEDTKDRIYIRDLDEELAEEANDDEERIVFIPDIDRRLNNLPKRLLAGDRSPDTTGNELVLYNVPSSLSVPQNQDSVRKAILESRARAQQQKDQEVQAFPSCDSMLHDKTGENMALEQHVPEQNGDHDEDAMEIG